MEKKRFGDRRDGRRIRDLDGMHVIMPHLMPNRADAEVYLSAQMDVTDALAYLAKKNEGQEEYRATLFHCFVMAVAKTIWERPRLNRFISGRRLYQRDKITLGFVVKRRFEDHSEESLMVAAAREDWTLSEVTRLIVGKVHQVRGQPSFGVDGALNAVGRLPQWLIRFIVWGYRTLDYFGRVPRFLTAEDPNYATVFLSNLGSIRSPAVYHHLNNHGTNSIMVTIGTIHKQDAFLPDGSRVTRDVVDVGVTLDERIADGFYFGRSWKIVQHLLAHPELLDCPLKEEIDFAC